MRSHTRGIISARPPGAVMLKLPVRQRVFQWRAPTAAALKLRLSGFCRDRAEDGPDGFARRPRGFVGFRVETSPVAYEPGRWRSREPH